jgi:hypothetical protein
MDPCPVCGDRDLVKPPQPEKVADAGASLPLDLPLTVVTLPATGPLESVVSPRDLTRPLHLIHCVWTC